MTTTDTATRIAELEKERERLRRLMRLTLEYGDATINESDKRECGVMFQEYGLKLSEINRELQQLKKERGEG